MVAAKKILVTGAGGLLGSEFKSLPQGGIAKEFEIIGKSHAELDITNPQQVENCLEKYRPDFLINCAAYTHVDKAELEVDLARKGNVEGPRVLAEACRKHSLKLVHYSTDFVFDGRKQTPYVEADPPSPLGNYGLTKWEGEKIIESLLPQNQFLILRISWPYGKNGKNFIHLFWELSQRQSEVRVVMDQRGVPNPAPLLALKTLEILRDFEGLFHLSCGGSCSRYELISFLFKKLKTPCRVVPVTSEEFPSPARRPAYSVLGTERKELASLKLPSWQEALEKYIEETSLSRL